MVIRRIREHVATHNWFAVAVDLGIVVIGVFIGMQVNNWNNDRLSRDQAREERAMLIDDLQANQQNMVVRTRYYAWVHLEAEKTLAALDRPSSDLGDEFLVDSYQSSQILPWSLKRNSYDQILSLGGIAALGDTALRDKITNYYVGADVTGQNLVSVSPYHEILRRRMPYAVQRLIRTDCGERITEDSRGQAVMVLPIGCRITLDPATSKEAVRQVHDTPGLSFDLNRLLVDLDQKLVSTTVISRRAAKLEAALKLESH